MKRAFYQLMLQWNHYIIKQKMTRKKQFFNKSIVIIAAVFSFTSACIASPTNKTEICRTAGCAEAAEILLKNIDDTINPCDNFYQFACGKLVKETVIPEDKSSVSLFSRKMDIVQDKLRETLSHELEKDDPETFKLLQSYYNVCLDTDKIQNSSIQDVKNILTELGNWPVIAGNTWNESNFDWQKLIFKLRKLGYTESAKSIVKYDIEIDEKNNTRYILTLDQAETGLDQEYLSKGLTEKVVQAYYKYMIDLAKIFGADPKQAEKELAESLNFEIALAKISMALEDRRNMSELYNLKTLKQLQSDYSYIPWNDYLNEITSPQSQIGLDDEVIVKVPKFLESLSNLLTKTPKRVLANYMFWRIVQGSSEFLNDDVRRSKAEFSASLTGTNVQQPRDKQCITYLSNNLPVAIGALYVRKNFDKKFKSEVEKLVNELRLSFDDMLKKVHWMDNATKQAAQIKLNSIQTHVAYPNEFFDDDILDNHFQSLKVDINSYLKSHLNLNLFDLGYKLEQLNKPVNKTSWIPHGISAYVNAYYQPPENSVQIPAGILQGEFFTSTRPSYMNYGAVGWIIGHEFTHGFDDQGCQYDKDGNLVNWWNSDTQKEYLKRAQCLIDQYSNYTVSEVGLNINGVNTQGENIADNGGIKEAYYAYENYEKRHGEESKLPGLPYNSRQIFWISAANTWCGKFRNAALKNRVHTDVHSPGEFRVVGSFSNMPEFSRDFNCPSGSPMNPTKKCIVW